MSRRMTENIIYYLVRGFGVCMRRLPLRFALWVGKFIGLLGYYFDRRHRALAYANLKVAFAKEKKPTAIRRIVKQLFQNYGKNIIELVRIPLINADNVGKHVVIEGREHLDACRRQGKGVILLAMHYGSWEMASLASALSGHPYKVIVKPQSRYSRLDELLNTYREAGGSVVVHRGIGTRDVIRSLHNNEVVGMVVDQGGKDGVLVPFFGRQASMSVGAIRIAMKMGTPVCFSVIVREGHRHRLIIHPPLELKRTGNAETDIKTNLNTVVGLMEQYVRNHPSEYMWFYKIWKYSKEAAITILSDGKIGHLRQSQKMAHMVEKALLERGVNCETKVIEVRYKNRFCSTMITVISFLSHPRFCEGRLRLLKWFLVKKSFLEIVSLKADFVISCGSSVAGVNFLLSRDYAAKSIAILRPSILGFRRYDAVVLPEHDPLPWRQIDKQRVIRTLGAPNLINDDLLAEGVQTLCQRFPHLKLGKLNKIGLLVGGASKRGFIRDSSFYLTIRQVKQALAQIDGEVLITTSRRTPPSIEAILKNEFRKSSRCPLLVIPNEKDIPGAIAGIMGLCQILIVSGDSISMVSEAASSGKCTIVFPVHQAVRGDQSDRHTIFLEHLSQQGYILLSDEKNLMMNIVEMVKGKIKTKRIDNDVTLMAAARQII